MMGLRDTDDGGWGYLRIQWEDAYTFQHEPGADKPYRATRKDNGRTLRAGTPGELADMIGDDYHNAPVPRT